MLADTNAHPSPASPHVFLSFLLAVVLYAPHLLYVMFDFFLHPWTPERKCLKQVITNFSSAKRK